MAYAHQEVGNPLVKQVDYFFFFGDLLEPFIVFRHQVCHCVLVHILGVARHTDRFQVHLLHGDAWGIDHAGVKVDKPLGLVSGLGWGYAFGRLNKQRHNGEK